MSVITLLNELPLWVLIIDAVILSAILAIATYHTVSGYLFMRRLERSAQHEELARPLIRQKYSESALFAKSAYIIRAIKKWGPSIIALTGIDKVWISRIKKRGSRKNVRRILDFSVNGGLFHVFLAAIRNTRISPLLLEWLARQTGTSGLRKIALSWKGEEYSGAEGLALLYSYREHLAEMTGEQEWHPRFFAVKLLLYDPEPRYARLVRESLDDSCTLVRRTVIEGMSIPDDVRKSVQAALVQAFLDDPMTEVRQAAKRRLDTDYAGAYTTDISTLTQIQQLHLTELLDPDSVADEDTAIRFLEKGDMEIRLIAARYLDLKGTLSLMLSGVSSGDREDYERKGRLLSRAAEVGVSGFFSAIKTCDNPGSLCISADLLKNNGPASGITLLAKKVFALPSSQKTLIPDANPYRSTVEAVILRGNDDAVNALETELSQQSRNKNIQDLLLDILAQAPVPFLTCILDGLLALLRDPGYPSADMLRSVILRVPHRYYLQQVLDIVKAPRESYPHRVRVEMFRLLAGMKEPYCIQYVLENLYILPLHESRELTGIFEDYDEKLFIERASEIFRHNDSRARSSLMLCLSDRMRTHFVDKIRDGLKDADPEVRIAAVWTLKDMADPGIMTACLDLLRDPVERVRKSAGHALGAHGGKEVFAHLEHILADPSEVDSVKTAVIYGLGESGENASAVILVSALDSTGSLEKPVILALAQRVDPEHVHLLLTSCSKGSDQLRQKISRIFRKMGDEGERALLASVSTENPKLRPCIHQLLEKTGFIDKMIRLLSHRDSEKRKLAASVLSLFDSTAAFRGLVLAARDPNQDVRIEVVKALEKLDTKEGRILLEELKNDPDKRVRKYTEWAMEKLKAKEL